MIKDVSIELIQKCVNHCIHCSSCSTEESVAMLDIDTMRRVIRTLQGLKVERVCLSGGEPFQRPPCLFPPYFPLLLYSSANTLFQIQHRKADHGFYRDDHHYNKRKYISYNTRRRSDHSAPFCIQNIALRV